MDVAPVVLLYGFATAVVVALAGGGPPAYQAARWLPTEALRHD